MSIKKQAVILTLLVALLIVVQIFAYRIGRFQYPALIPTPVTVFPTALRSAPLQPSMTAADTIAQQNMHPFSLLISYVDSGFEPTTAHLRAGETVRFTNNSTADLWVASSGAQLYPSIQNECGSSALDSCQALHPGEFWEFTFGKKGTWTYVNNLDKTKTGVVVVQ